MLYVQRKALASCILYKIMKINYLYNLLGLTLKSNKGNLENISIYKDDIIENNGFKKNLSILDVVKNEKKSLLRKEKLSKLSEKLFMNDPMILNQSKIDKSIDDCNNKKKKESTTVYTDQYEILNLFKMTKGHAGHSMIGIDNKLIYIIGGVNDNKTCNVFNIDDEIMEEFLSMNYANVKFIKN